MDSVLRGVYDLAALENTAGGSVTAIGWPTQGGECGSELLASSDHRHMRDRRHGRGLGLPEILP